MMFQTLSLALVAGCRTELLDNWFHSVQQTDIKVKVHLSFSSRSRYAGAFLLTAARARRLVEVCWSMGFVEP